MTPKPTTCITFFEQHPACLSVFAGPGAIFHFLLGWLIGTLDPTVAVAIAMMFSGYQVSQAQSGEVWSSTGGELVEFGLGVLMGHTFKRR